MAPATAVRMLLVSITVGVCVVSTSAQDAMRPDTPAAAAAAEEMSGHMMESAPAHRPVSATSADNAHMRMSPIRSVTAGDSARAREVLSELRAALEEYRDVRVAERDGYRIFLPNVPQPVYHFTSWVRGIDAAFSFDPRKPSSLLYRRTASGGYELVGAMFTAPARASLDELDRRVPLSIASWHQHVNWCTPKPGDRARWLEMRDDKPVFGPKSPIATREACDAVGGAFHPRLFGWMLHVQPFATDPTESWGGGEMHHHHMEGAPATGVAQ